jgi:hypothetical protein
VITTERVGSNRHTAGNDVRIHLGGDSRRTIRQRLRLNCGSAGCGPPPLRCNQVPLIVQRRKRSHRLDRIGPPNPPNPPNRPSRPSRPSGTGGVRSVTPTGRRGRAPRCGPG